MQYWRKLGSEGRSNLPTVPNGVPDSMTLPSVDLALRATPSHVRLFSKLFDSLSRSFVQVNSMFPTFVSYFAYLGHNVLSGTEARSPRV